MALKPKTNQDKLNRDWTRWVRVSGYINPIWCNSPIWSYMSRSSVISPLSFQVATVQNSTWKLFPVGGTTLSGIFIGPFIVPEKSATEHV